MDRLKTILLRGIDKFQEDKVTVYSGYAALFIIASVFPLIILIIAIVNLLPGYSAKDVSDILFLILPDLSSVRELVESAMKNLNNQSGGILASLAALTTLWSASKGVQAIKEGLDQMDIGIRSGEAKDEDAIALAEKTRSVVRSTLKELLYTVMLVLLIPALLVFDMLGDSIAGVICSALKRVNPDVSEKTLSFIDSFFDISFLIVIPVALLVILLIYAALPAKTRTLKSQLPGALLTVISWIAFTELFSFFIPKFFRASSLYGSLASLFLLMLWLRYVVMILFAGGVLNRTIEEQRKKKA